MANEYGIKQYLREMERYPLLTPIEEKALAIRIREGDGDARERLAACNLRLVMSIARQYQNRGLNLLDLIGEGNIGLMKAVGKFDPDRGNRFSTCATWWIHQSIKRGLYDTLHNVRIPAYMSERLVRYRKQASVLMQQLCREPSQSEVIDSLGIRKQNAVAVRKAVNTYNGRNKGISLDGLEEMIFDKCTKTPDVINAHRSDLEKLSLALKLIKGRDADILQMRYGVSGYDRTTLQEIGDAMKLSRERIRQIERQTLNRLRLLMNEITESAQPL